MRMAFHVPRASHLKPGFSGDKILVRGLLEGLAQRGHEVQVVSRLNVRNIWRGRVGPEELQSEIRRIRAAMEEFSPDAWLVYGASTTNPDLIGWQLMAEQTPRPMKSLLLSTDLGSGKRLPSNWRRMFSWIHHHSLAQSDWVTAYHPDSRDDLLRHGLPERRVLLAPPAVCPWKSIPTMQDARRQLGLPPDRPVLFCASRFPSADEHDPGKMRMLLNLINAIRALPSETIVVIAGDGPGRVSLERAIADLPHPHTVRLVGPVQHEAMVSYYAACDFFVYPHPVDRPWLAVLEAQSCSRAVVTTRTRSAQLTVQDRKTGLLASNPEEFCDAICALAVNRPQAQSMGRAAGSYVAENHSRDARLDLIEQLLDQPNWEAEGQSQPPSASLWTANSPNGVALNFASELSETDSHQN